MARTRHTGFGRAFQLTLAAVVVTALAAAFWGSHRIARDVRVFVTDSFNAEQLLLARHARLLIERELQQLGREVAVTARTIGNDGFDPERDGAVLATSLARLHDGGLRRIVVRPPGDVQWVALPFAARLREEPRPAADLVDSLAARLEPGGLAVPPPSVAPGAVTLLLAARLRGPPGGLLIYDVDLARLLVPFLRDIRSGRTGYAWIIDGDGRFLYHPDESFEGRNAFRVRSEQAPELTFDSINQIQREHMMAGEEGMAAYVSGRHGSRTGRIEKLIAYTPVRVGHAPAQTWSVAVVAPTDDLRDLLARGQRWQALLLAIAAGTVALGAAALLLREARWARVLGRRVAQRTAELRRSEERYRSLVDGSEDLIIAVDDAGAILALNPAAARFLGGTRDILRGTSLVDRFPAAERRRLQEQIRRTLQERSSRRDEFIIAEGGGNGRRVRLNASLVPLRDESGEATRVLWVGRDVTEQRDLEANLIRTERLAALGTLAAGFAHEVNNPLGVMLGFNELLLARAEPGSRDHEELEVVQRQGRQCQRIVENLLSFARGGTGGAERCDVNVVVAEMSAVVRHALEMHGVRLVLDLAEALPPARVDPRELQQVLLNLVQNAADAQPEGGEVRIRTRHLAPQQQVEITVADDGPGIPAADRQRIFAPFYTTKPEGKGTGLGLFVSYGIVERHGGDLLCGSRTALETDAGTGTTFTVRLPEVSRGPQDGKT
ncbi:MAG: ATP-binding protein [Candidatus Krumholzibacteriia bacterium]